MIIFKYALIRGFLKPMSLALNIVIPLIILVLGNNIHVLNTNISTYGRSYTIGMFIMVGGFIMARSIQADKQDNVIVRILASPISMRDYLIQNFFAALVPMILISIFIGAIGIVTSGWQISFAIGVVLCYVLLSATSIGLSFTWSCLFKSRDLSNAVYSIFITIVGLISGLITPQTILPDTILYLGALFPAHWAARSIGAIYEYGFSEEYWMGIAAMFLFAVAYLLYGGKRGVV